MFSFFRRLRRCPQPSSQGQKPRPHAGWPKEPLALLLLEDRITPTTLHWTGAASSNWSAVGNWAEGVAPASGDTLVFDTTTPGFAATTAAFAPDDDVSGLTGLALVLNSASSAGNFVLAAPPSGWRRPGSRWPPPCRPAPRRPAPSRPSTTRWPSGPTRR